MHRFEIFIASSLSTSPCYSGFFLLVALNEPSKVAHTLKKTFWPTYVTNGHNHSHSTAISVLTLTLAAILLFSILQNDDNGESTFTLEGCIPADSGQYWVEAENRFGKSDTVAWVTVIDAPDMPPSVTYKPVRGSGLKLQWKQPHKGNAKYVWYIVEYKCEGSLI